MRISAVVPNAWQVNLVIPDDRDEPALSRKDNDAPRSPSRVIVV